MRSALLASVREALDRPWVLDMDATIKPLYGRRKVRKSARAMVAYICQRIVAQIGLPTPPPTLAAPG